MTRASSLRRLSPLLLLTAVLAVFSVHGAQPASAQAPGTTVWSATMTAGNFPEFFFEAGFNSYDDHQIAHTGSLTDNDFTYKGREYEVKWLVPRAGGGGLLQFGLDKQIPLDLVLHVGSKQFRMTDGTFSSSGGGPHGNFKYWENSGVASPSPGDTIQVSLVVGSPLPAVAELHVSGPPNFVVHEDRDRGAQFAVYPRQRVKHSFTVDYATKDGTVSTQYRPRPKPYVDNNCGVDQNGDTLDYYNWCKIPNSPAATAPADYTATSGTLTFAPGEKFKVVFVPIVNDTVEDSGENFRLVISNPSALARIAYGEASVVILNDEADLSALTVEGAAGAGGPWSALDIGAFEAETTDYAVTVPHGTTHVRLAPTAAEPGTTMRTGAGSNLEAVRSGETGPAVALEAGENTLIVSAVAQSGARKTYTVTVTRQAGPVVAAPLADVGELEAGVSRNISLSGVFTDADSDRLTISAGSSDTSKAAVSVAADSSALTLSGIAAGTTTITVTAQDADGNTVSDAFQVEVVRAPEPEPEPVELPGPVGNLQLTATHDSVSVSWSAPESGDAPDGYIVNIKRQGGGDGETRRPGAGKTALTFLDLNGGATYKVWVRAQNEAGKGERTHATITLPSVLPGPVTGLEVTATEDGVTVSWSAPETGGAPDGYIVHIRPEGGAEGSGRTKTPKAKKTKVTFENLEAGRTYNVWVRAENEAGKGERVHAGITIPAAQ